jgi:hypothetical protein
MYTYYALSVVHIPVPGVLKRSLTKIQITQFIVGGSLGALTLLLRLPKEIGEKFEWQPVLANHPFASDRLGPGFQEHLCLHTPGQMVTVVGGVGCTYISSLDTTQPQIKRKVNADNTFVYPFLSFFFFFYRSYPIDRLICIILPPSLPKENQS